MPRQVITSFLIALGVTLLVSLLIFPPGQGISPPPTIMTIIFIVTFAISFLFLSRAKKKKPDTTARKPAGKRNNKTNSDPVNLTKL